MTTLGTKYQQAENWSTRLNVACDIWQEVREESLAGLPIVQGPDIDPFEELYDDPSDPEAI